MDKIKLIDKVNSDLTVQFGPKHIPITMGCIEKTYKRQLLSLNADAKTVKGLKMGYLTGILYLAPASLSGVNICPSASKGCRSACLYTAGRGRFYSVTRARIVKTLAYHFDKPRFYQAIKKSIDSLLVKAKNKGLTPCVRLNGTSDILWEHTGIMQAYPELQFYDYTKIYKRFYLTLPSNYNLTFSLTESNWVDAESVLIGGHNIAMVFRDTIPSNFMTFQVISGDDTDLRFLDAKGFIIGLKAKGMAKKDKSGFVYDNDSLDKKAA